MREGHANISDTLTALTSLVDIYNDHMNELGHDGSWALLDMLADGIARIQDLNPILFTVEEFNWINELATQLNEIDSITQEGENNES
jgi:hypothetical protein